MDKVKSKEAWGHGHEECLDLLLAAGAKMQEQDLSGKTAA